MNGAAVVWRSRTLRIALAAFPLWCTASLLIFNAPWRFRLPVTALFVVTAVAPHVGLLILTAFVPLGHLVEAGLKLYPFRLTEAMVLAFFAGWLVRGRTDCDGPRVPATAGWLLALVIGASVVAQLWAALRQPDELLEDLQVLYQAYFLIPDRIGFGAAALLLEGLGLMAAAATLFRSRPRLAVTLPMLMTASAVVAAASSLLLSRGIAFPRILEEHARIVVRTSAHVADPNAAASYFGMMLFVALGMAARRPVTDGRAFSRASLLWLAAAVGLIAGLMLAGSRSGIAAGSLGAVVAAVCALTATWRPRTRTVAIAVALVVVLAGGLLRAWMLRADPGAGFRQQFYVTSVRMIADHPVAGVGVGRYYDRSVFYASPEISWTYPSENAHNFFLQVTGEIGLPGLALLLAVIGLIGFDAMPGVARSPRDLRLLGCTVGVMTMLATWLSGHPLLVGEVAFPFWILLGLLAGLGGSVLIDSRERSRRAERFPGSRLSIAVLAATLILVVGQVSTARRTPPLPRSSGVTGLEPWETDASGARFRWTHEYASIFVPVNATRVYIPVRLPVDIPRLLPMAVDVKVSGVDRGRTLVGTEWAILNLELPHAPPNQRVKRIDLKIQRTWQPAVYLAGSNDLRKVGVQVGEIKEFYEY